MKTRSDNPDRACFELQRAAPFDLAESGRRTGTPDAVQPWLPFHTSQA